MNTKTGKTHYELLDIQPGASTDEIAKAYQRARAIYSSDSVAAYSLYTPEELDQLNDAITEAYETLSDPDRRVEYDREHLSGAGGARESSVHPVEPVIDIAASVEDDGYEPPKASGHKARFRHRLVVMDEADTMATEQYRILFTKLDSMSSARSIKVIAITSSVKGEGKTVTSMNLAYLMAKEFKKRVALLECDLKKPSITTRYMDDNSAVGLVDVLRGDALPAEAMVRVEDTDLSIMPARHSVRNSAELLGQRRLRSLIDKLRSSYDYVIIDCPPIMPLADVGVITRLVDGVVMVVRAGKTPKDIVKKAVNSISDANILGIILNAAEMSIKKYYY